MNRKFLGAFLCLTVILVSTGVASAQSLVLAANVPFDFNFGDTQLRSGRYTVRVIGNHVVELMDAEGKGASRLSIAAYGSKAVPNNALIFTRYGNDYFLSKVVWDGGTAEELLPGKAEIKVAKSYRGIKRIETVSAK